MRQKTKRKLRQRREQPFAATDQCENCGDEFANHKYVKDSITQYKCPTPHQDSGYGYGYRGIDPKKYHPDYECCSNEEIQRWKDACEVVNRGEVYTGGYSWGIGVYTFECDQFFEKFGVKG
jgi:hypothetical protein